MSRQEQGAKAKAAQEQRLVQYIRDGLSTHEIARREGIDPTNVSTIRKNIAKKFGLTVWAAPPAKALPYGLTKQSAQFRGNLAIAIDRVQRDYHPVDLAGLIGVSNVNQTRARQGAGTYDWTLGQIERLAKLEGKTFKEFMKELLA